MCHLADVGLPGHPNYGRRFPVQNSRLYVLCGSVSAGILRRPWEADLPVVPEFLGAT